MRVLAAVLAAVATLTVVGCSNPAKDAEDQYNIVAASGDHDQRCDAAGKVRDAWLKEKNKAQYDSWELRARIECTSAQINRMQP